MLTGYKFYANGSVYNDAGTLTPNAHYWMQGNAMAPSNFFGVGNGMGQALAFNGTDLAAGDISSPPGPGGGLGCSGANANGSIAIFRMPATSGGGPNLSTKLQPWLSSSTSQMGARVATDGTFVAAANVFGEDPTGGGSVTLFKSGGGVNREVGKYLPGWATFGGSPATTSYGNGIDINGTFLVACAPYGFATDVGLSTGACYVYGKTNGEFTVTARPQQVFSPPGVVDGETFGNSVALTGTTMAVGAPSFGASGPGAVYVYNADTTGSVFRQKLTANDGMADDGFGTSVDAFGNYIFVGAPSNTNTRGTAAGAVYIFQLVNGTYTFQRKVLPPGPLADGRFGLDVNVGGTFAAIFWANAGKMFMLRQSGTSWVTDGTTGQIGPGTSVPGWGSAAAIEGTNLIIGSFFEDKVYRYQRSATTGVWNQTGVLTGTVGDFFGYAVDIRNGMVAIGSLSTPSGTMTPGAAFLTTVARVQ
jgi:hypothetical protein